MKRAPSRPRPSRNRLPLVALVALTETLGCSESGIQRRPGVPGPAAPALPDLIGPADPGVQNPFCGLIGSGGIRAIAALGTDGSFAVAYGTGRIAVYDIQQRSNSRNLLAHGSPITHLQVAADQRLMVSAAESGEVKLWRVPEGELVRVVRDPGTGPVAVAISPDGSRLALSTWNRLEVQQSLEGAELWHAERPATGVLLAFSADGERLADGGSPVVHRRARDGEVVQQVAVEQFGMRAVSDDLSMMLGMRSRTRELTLIAADGSHRWTAVQPNTASFDVTAAAFSPDGSQVAFTTRGGGLQLVSTADGTVLRSWPVPDGSGSALAFSRDGTEVTLGLAQGALRTWSLASGELLLGQAGSPGHLQPATKVTFSPDGKLIVSQAEPHGRDGSLKVWRAGDGALLFADERNPRDGADRSFAIAPDSGTIALTGGVIAAQIYLLRPTDGALLGTIENADATSLAYSPDGQWLVGRSYCAGCLPQALRVWRVSDRAEQPGFGDMNVHDGHGPTFSPDGALLAATSNGLRSPPATAVAVWRVYDRQLLWSAPGATFKAFAAAFSPDGAQLALATADAPVRIHNSRDGSMVRELAASGVRAVAFSPAGDLATAGDSGLRLWRAADGQPIAERAGSFTAVAFAPDGRRAVAAGRDGTLTLLCGFGQSLP